MTPSSLTIRVGIAVSIAIHLAVLAVSLGYAGAGLFDAPVAEAVAVSIVTPDDLEKSVASPSTPVEKEDLTKRDLRLTPLDGAAQSSATLKPETKATTSAKTTAAAPATQPSKTAESNPGAPQPAFTAPPPDISLRYQVDLGLKKIATSAPTQQPQGGGTSDFDAPAMRKAEIDRSGVAAFRDRLKACATRPANVAPDDKIVIVLRATFMPDGMLAAAPTLIEASASAKGPALMQAAIAALQKCQPHKILPADKYNEWRVLDLSFTPQDFNNG